MLFLFIQIKIFTHWSWCEQAFIQFFPHPQNESCAIIRHTFCSVQAQTLRYDDSRLKTTLCALLTA